MLLGFNLVAMAPHVDVALIGWVIYNYLSHSLVVLHNCAQPILMRTKAHFAYGIYAFSNFAVVCVASCMLYANVIDKHSSPQLVSAAVIVTALLQSTQLPFVTLLMRPTPASAVNVGVLSAHVGVVLLSDTLPIWFAFDWARLAVATLGLFTVGWASLVSRLSVDRLGSLSHSTSTTLILSYVALALDYSDFALLLSCGHATFRTLLTLR